MKRILKKLLGIDLEYRIEALERQVIYLKYPEGFKIGSEVSAANFGGGPKKCFIASEIEMDGKPYIWVFVPELDPPLRRIPVESLITSK